MSAERCLAINGVIVGAEDVAVFRWPFDVISGLHPLPFLNFVFCCFLRKFLRRRHSILRVGCCGGQNILGVGSRVVEIGAAFDADGELAVLLATAAACGESNGI